MAFNEQLTKRIREALAGIRNVEEKRMFRGMTFMVNGKMCITAGDDRIMCRVGPDAHDAAVKRKGCRTVVMGGKKYKGFIYVNEENIKSKKDLGYWIKLALDFNKIAKASPKRKKK